MKKQLRRTRCVRLFAPATDAAKLNRAARLARVLPLWSHELNDTSIAGRRRIIAKLERALRQERVRGTFGHWAYDLARHASLARALAMEKLALKDLAAPQIVDKQKARTRGPDFSE